MPKISAGHGWSWKILFANFQTLGPLGCQGWVVIPQNVKKSQNHCTLLSSVQVLPKKSIPPLPPPPQSIVVSGVQRAEGWKLNGSIYPCSSLNRHNQTAVYHVSCLLVKGAIQRPNLLVRVQGKTTYCIFLFEIPVLVSLLKEPKYFVWITDLRSKEKRV